MDTSVVNLFTIGIGPSSSHTVGPMRAAFEFARRLREDGVVPVRVKCDLYGSLSLTGKGHGTDGAVILGLAGETPERIDPDVVPALVARIREQKSLPLCGAEPVPFCEERDITFHKSFLAAHPNTLAFTAVLADGSCITRRYHSVGGGRDPLGRRTAGPCQCQASLPFRIGR